jgi:hypothetical protein
MTVSGLQEGCGRIYTHKCRMESSNQRGQRTIFLVHRGHVRRRRWPVGAASQPEEAFVEVGRIAGPDRIAEPLCWRMRLKYERDVIFSEQSKKGRRRIK